METNPNMKLYVRETGSPTNPAIVFLHASPLSGRMWLPQLERLTEFHCLAPDLPGHGQSASLPALAGFLNDNDAGTAKAALNAGKHVLVEKPLALTVEDCLRVGRAVQRAGITLMTGFKMRYYDLVQRAKGMLPHPLMLTMQMATRYHPKKICAGRPIFPVFILPRISSRSPSS